MKTRLLFIPLAALFTAPLAHAQLTWDANGTTANQTNGGGAWLGANLWWNGSANQNWVSGSDAIFGGPNTAGGAVTLASPTAVGSITFNTFTGTYTLGTTGNALTINSGITMNAGVGAVTMASPITLGGAQTWTNNSASTLQVNTPGITNAGYLLTIDGTGTTSFGVINNNSVTISGSGGLTKNGNGRFSFGGNNTGYSGTTTLNGGVTIVTAIGSIGSGNLTLNGGVYEEYWTNTFTRTLGSGPGQVQLIGGASGFSENGSIGMTVKLNNNTAFEAVWGASGEGAATGFFNPSTLVLQAASAQTTSNLNFQNPIDLNGATRTVAVNSTGASNPATISGVIRTSSGTAGLIKTGPGILILSAANTYDGGTTINQGNLRFSSLTAMPSSGNVTVNAGATLTVEAGAAGDWTSGTSGAGTLGGLFSGIGSTGTSTVSFATDSTLGLEMTGNLTYAGDIPDFGTNVGITKTGGSSLTLTGNNSYSGRTRVHAGTLSFNSIANVGGGSSALGAPMTAANGTINVGSGGTAATITYTGSGHGSDRVINLSGSTGGAIIESSGAGPLTLTSSLTAAAGAKTLTLGGTNIGENSLPAMTLAGLAEVLTIQKAGAGTWRINGFSSPKNAWSVTAGTLLVAGGITTGDQNVTVSGGTLAGVGPITLQSTKSLTVGAAGSLSPGISGAGTMTLTGILNISAMAGGSGKLNFEMAAPASSDKIAVTGTAQIGNGLLGLNDFVFTDLGGMTGSTYVLISTTGGITGTLDPANRQGTIGSISGALQINGNNLEFVIDSDLDGLPDSYELANTTPPSATALDPNADIENGGAGDGLTNLQEYLLGTNPNNPDTDADGLLDGVETNTGTWVSASNTGTNPLVLDTDGDTIRDGYETKTGIYVSSTDTGTNPNLADTDADALTDNVETSTGTFVSKTNTGTNPNNPDTDADGAGDWYEVTASLTNPFSAASKPNVPYPLTDPDSSTGATDKPVKVYIMSGQSNMVGAGTVSGTGDGTLETMTLRQNKFPNLVTSSGAWTARQDVYYRGVISATADKPLGPGCGSGSGTIGPELGFGHVMGWFHDEGVLLLKSSIGNRALGWDILPAGSARYEFGGFTYCGSGDAAEKWAVGSPAPTWTTGGWYAGYEWDRFFRDESEWIHPHAAEVNVVDILDNWNTQHYGAAGKHFAGRDFQIAGFVWWQGERDAGDAGHSSRYEQNLVHLINSLRSYYSNRYPGKIVANAPFVMATLGETSTTDGPSNSKTVFDAMMAVDGDSGKYSQFAGNVKTVYSYPLSEGGSGNGHYNNRAGTYMIVGDAMGRAMIDLQSATPPANDYATWAALYPGHDLTDSNADLDGDGQTNNEERVWGLDPTSGASSNPISVPYNAATGTLTYTRRNPALNTGVTYLYQSSDTLAADDWQAFTPSNVVANGASPVESVTITLPGALLANPKLFVRVFATSN